MVMEVNYCYGRLSMLIEVTMVADVQKFACV